MSLCIYPACYQSNPDDCEVCQTCGSALILNQQFRVQKVILQDKRRSTDVYEAIDVESGATKILKVLARYSDRQLYYFQREAKILEALRGENPASQPRIPTIDLDSYFAYTPPQGYFPLHCIAQDKIEGRTLSEWIVNEPTPSTQQALNWLKQLAELVHSVHRRHHMHRDIKPENLIVDEDGQIWLIDFGSARNFQTETYLLKIAPAPPINEIPDEFDITSWVSVGYTPSEQMQGRAVTQSDFFAMGRTMVHLITGHHPKDLQIKDQPEQIEWRQYAQHIDKPLLDYIDGLMAQSIFERPRDTKQILSDLEHQLPKALRRDRLIKSKTFQVTCLGLTIPVFFGLSQIYSAHQYQQHLAAGNSYILEAGVSKDKSKNYELAKANYETALKYRPKDVTALNNLGTACEALNQESCALENYSRAVSLDPNWEGYLNLGSHYDERQNYKLAREYYKKAIDLSHSQQAAPLNDLARLDIISGDYQAATALIDKGFKVVNNDETKTALLKNMAWINVKQSRYTEAEKYLNQINVKQERTDVYCLRSRIAEARHNEAQFKIFSITCLVANLDDASSPEVQQRRDEISQYLELR